MKEILAGLSFGHNGASLYEWQLVASNLYKGGFPCQSFSVSAQNPKRLGIKDEKGTLFFEMIRVLKAYQPKAFFAENVKGILSANNK